jgi:hypothetical protein
LSELGESRLDFVVERKPAHVRLGENQAAVHEHVELSRLARDDFSFLAKS